MRTFYIIDIIVNVFRIGAFIFLCWKIAMYDVFVLACFILLFLDISVIYAVLKKYKLKLHQVIDSVNILAHMHNDLPSDKDKTND